MRFGPLKPSFINTYSLDFDGMDDYVDVGEIPPLFKKFPIGTAKDNPWSASMWVKGSTSGAFLQLPYGEINSLSARAFAFALGASGLYFGGKFTNIKIRESGTTAYNSSGWNHIVMTFDGVDYTALSSYKLYVNGTLIPIELIPTNITDFRVKSILIGGTQLPWLGKIDEVSLFDAELTTSNVTSIYNGGKPTDLTPLNPIAWYRMGDNGAYKSPQWLLPNNENKDKVSNYSLEFDGVNDKVSLTSLIPLGLTSISFWMKSTHSSGNDSITSGLGNLGFIGTTPLVYLSSANYRYFADQASKFDGEWHHWFLLIAGSGQSDITNSRLFVDGVEISSGTTISSIPPSLWTNSEIGRGQYGYLNCSINNFAVWEGSDESANVSTIYNSGTPNDISSLSPNVWLKIGEEATFSTNWTVPDNVSSNDGTSANMTIEDRVGTAPSSSNNALSFNMDLIDRVEDTP